MPAETHQLGRSLDPEGMAELLITLLDPDIDSPDETTLADCGVGAGDVDRLWDAVCEEVAERTVSPDLEPGTLDPGMTVRAAAEAMVALLVEEHDDEDR